MRQWDPCELLFVTVGVLGPLSTLFVAAALSLVVLLVGLSCLLRRLFVLLLLMLFMSFLRRGDGKLVVICVISVAIGKRGMMVLGCRVVVVMMMIAYLVRGEMQIIIVIVVVILVEGAEGRRRGTALRLLGCGTELSGKVGHFVLFCYVLLKKQLPTQCPCLPLT